jgi:apolipoprotein N-acyltransferase
MTAPMKRWFPLIPAVLSGVLCALAFPRHDLESLAWFALVPLLLSLEGRTVRASFWLGWLTGTVAFLGTVHWVTVTMIRYGKMSPLASYPIMLLFVVYLGLYVGVFAALLTFLKRRTSFPTVLSAPAIWTSLELLRTYALSGFPWSLLGYSQYLSLPVIQIADVTGVYGISFLIVMVNAALAQGADELKRKWFSRSPNDHPVLTNPPRPVVMRRRFSFRPSAGDGRVRWKPIMAAFLVVALDLGYGAWRLSEDKASNPPTVRVGVVQANIPQDVKWDPRFRLQTIQRYERLTRRLDTQSLDLILWPEAATPFLFEQDEAFQKEVIGVVREGRIPLLFGSPAMTNASDRIWMFNSAYYLSADGRILDRYDKMHLVPFGEYVPLSGILSFVNKLVEGIGDFLPGEDYTLFQLPNEGFGTVICYEVIFPDLVRHFVKEGAAFMTTITNDAWFGRSAAPYQHFSMVVLRAVENRVPFARAANTGVSGFIDRTGRIQKSTAMFVEAAAADTLRLRTETTFYTRYGDVFAYACVIMTLLMIGAAIQIDPKGEEFSYA